jgi:hypothetical protein
MFDHLVNHNLVAEARDAHAAAVIAVFSAREAVTVASAEREAAKTAMDAAISGNGSDPHDATELHTAAANRLGVLTAVHGSRVSQHDAAREAIADAMAESYKPVYQAAADARYAACREATALLAALAVQEQAYSDATASIQAAIGHGVPDLTHHQGLGVGVPMVALVDVNADEAKRTPLDHETWRWTSARRADAWLDPS